MHDSPVVDTEKPVSRQQEIAMREYWGPLACWEQRDLSFLHSNWSEVPGTHRRGLHLRSTAHMLGYQIWATDGDFGILEACHG